MRRRATLFPALLLTLAFAAPVPAQGQGQGVNTTRPPNFQLQILWNPADGTAVLRTTFFVNANGDGKTMFPVILTPMHITVVEPRENKPGFVRFTAQFDVVNESGKPVVWRAVEGGESYPLFFVVGDPVPIPGDLTVGANGKALFSATLPLPIS